jgi:hypothetical protein
MPRNAQGMWVSQEQLDAENDKQGKTSALFSHNFRDDLTSLDFQKIIVEQNNTIINLLAMQIDNTIQGVLNASVKKDYSRAIRKFLKDN